MNDSNWQSAYRILFNWSFLTAGDVSDWLDLPKRKVLMLVEQGLVQPVDPAPGTGKTRKYSLTELLSFLVFSKLDAFGIAPRYLKSISSDVNHILRARVSVQGERPALLVILKDEGKKLRVLVGDSASNFQDITMIVHLKAIETQVLEIFLKNAPLSGEGNQLLRMVGREYDSDGIEKAIEKWVAGKEDNDE